MDTSDARYAHEDGTWFIKLSGDVRHPLGPALNALLDQAFATPDTTQFLVDLSETKTIDSTCLGVLARIANWSRKKATAQPIIVASSEDITETLRAVCFDRLFDLRDQSIGGAEAFREISRQPADAAQMAELVLETHRRLCDIDERNKAVFQSLVEALEQETGRHRND
jgi:anti-anti-sigma factor